MGREDRRAPRADIRWPVTIETDHGLIDAETRNLSKTGAYIHCTETPRPSEKVTIMLQPPNRSSLKIIAEVLWAGEILPPGMAVRFLEISEEAKNLIAAEVLDQLRLERKELESLDTDEILLLEPDETDLTPL
jgi:hypothetical protein